MLGRYVMIKAATGAKAWEKAEDPVYVLDNNIPIDTSWCARLASAARAALRHTPPLPFLGDNILGDIISEISSRRYHLGDIISEISSRR